MKTNIREYVEREPVEIKERDGRLIIEALNEGGHNGTEVDLMDVIKWVEVNRPDLITFSSHLPL
jgi:hypothetical protein